MLFSQKSDPSSNPSFVKKKFRLAHTIGKEVRSQGKGLFTGENSELRFIPSSEKSGICFQRIDLKGAPLFRADLSLVQGTPRCTIIGNEFFSVQTIEHLMAALSAYQIDNILIQLTGPEVPVFDGSSLKFVQMLEEAGLLEQKEEKEILSLQTPVYCTEKEALLIALPSQEMKISYTLHYPHASCVGTQFYSTIIQNDIFKESIAPCRTFSVYEEIAPLIEKGFLKGGSLENAVVFKDNQVMNPEGLRFQDEMVRHKVLDMMGDLYLMGISFTAHIIAIRSGHFVNNIFANELLNRFKREGL